jgi:selenocysteine lyase/cysteine desulfurase
MDGAMPNAIAKRLSEHGGIGVRYGCHCSHLLVKNLLGVGPGLERFQKVLLTVLPKVRLPGLLRVSMGIGNSEDDVDTLISVLEEIGRGKRKKG